MNEEVNQSLIDCFNTSFKERERETYRARERERESERERVRPNQAIYKMQIESQLPSFKTGIFKRFKGSPEYFCSHLSKL